MSSSRYRLRVAALLCSLGLGCKEEPRPTPPPPPIAVAPVAPDLAPAAPSSALAPALKPPRPSVKAEQAPPASPRSAEVKEADLLRGRVESYFQGHVGRRVYIQTDKPLYKPGETIWLRLWDLKARSLGGDHAGSGMIVELVSPRGAVVLKRKVREQKGAAQGDLPLPAGSAGGEYTIRVQTLDGQRGERPVVVSSYEAPRLQMKLEFLRKAYGAGDEVSATIAVRRATGEPLRNHALSGRVRLDGEDLPPVTLRTDDAGEGVVRFTLPGRIDVGDGLLTVLADDGGLTESVARRVPIIVSKLSFGSFPEGGQLVEGLPGRVYFEAKNPLGKPADVAGRVVDDTGRTVAQLESARDGLGRFDLTPAPGRSYHVEIDRPVGIEGQYPLPLPLVAGCALRSFDDLDGELPALRVAVRCTGPQRVVVAATLRESFLDAAAVDVPAGAPAIVYLEPRSDPALGRAQGVARVTVFDERLNPLAERLVYRNRRARLGVKIEANKTAYSPRDQVALTVRTTDPAGQPVPAELALSVVDDTVLTFADDKTGHMLSRLYLEPELEGKIEEPNFYMDLAEEKSALATDLLMGVRGFRRFEWRPILNPLQPGAQLAKAPSTGAAPEEGDFGGLRKAKAKPALALAKAADAKPVELPKKAKADLDEPLAGLADDAEAAPRRAAPPKDEARAEVVAGLAPAPQGVEKALRQPLGAAADKATREEAAVEHQRAAPRPAATRAAAAPAPAAEPVMAATPPAAPPPPNRLGGMGGAMRDVAGPGDLGAMAVNQKERAAPEAKKPAPPRAAGGRARMNADIGDPLGGDPLGGDPLGGPLWGPQPGAWHRPGLVRRQAPRPRQPALDWAPVRVFPAPTYAADYAGPRTDFRETLYFQPEVRTGKDGQVTLTFYLSDAISAFRVIAEGVAGGAAGRTESVLKSSLPFSMGVKVPLEVSEGDHIDLPLVLTNERERPLAVDLTASFGDLLKLDRPVQRTQGTLAAGAREALFYPLTVTGKRGRSKVRFDAGASGLRDEFEREVVVSPRGFPQHFARSGQVKDHDRVAIAVDLGAMLPGTADGKVRLYPSPVASMVSGLEGLLQEPSGCFEQASSTNYPNVMILRYLKEQHHADAELLQRTGQLLDSGYKKLVGYETPRKGYEWFGAAPANEALTAYGLQQFTDMQAVYGNVERDMLQRTAAWLRDRRDGKGGYARDGKALDSFGRASKEVTDAYITYSLAEAKQKDLDPEMDAMDRLGRGSSDAYVLALATGALLGYGRRDAGLAAAQRLAALQDGGGGFLKADHSITRSGGDSLHIETTSLAILALLRAGGYDEPVRRAVEWMMSHRGGYGQFGATQATVLALKALTAYAVASRRTQAPGDVTVLVNGQVAGRERYEAGRRAPLVFADVERHLRPGPNQIELVHEGGGPLPFSLGLDYRSLTPASSKAAPVEIETALEKTRVGLGESVRLNVTLRNRGAAGLPMTLGRVGLPGGLTFQTWQLKELRDKGLIAFYETGPREVVLYLRDMQPRQELRLPLDLVATVPGRFKAPASRAYLYYTSEHKSWAEGTEVTVTP